MIHVVAYLQVDPAKREAFLARFAELKPLVEAEDGCLEYGAAVDATTGSEAQQPVGDDHVVVVEKWESVEALEKHLAAPHMEEFRAAVADMLRGVKLSILSPA